MNKRYFDYAATTPVDERVLNAMLQHLTVDSNFGNPASRSHSFGWDAENAVTQARADVAELIGAQATEIVWTSGATEANNLALKGAMHFYKEKGKHLITSAIEHKAILDTCRHLETEGFEITQLTPNKDGTVDPEAVKAAIREDTVLISLMHVNNEIGSVNNLQKIGEIATEKGIFFHVDAAQSFGKIPIDVQSMHISLLSVSGHKIYAPKGIGFLYVRKRPRVRLKPLMHGGGHERGMRSGTLPVHQIVALAMAATVAKEDMQKDTEHAMRLKQMLYNRFANMEQVFLNGSLDNSSPFILNMSFGCVEGESLLMSINENAVSSGSACTSASLEPSYVLRALGLNDELAHSSLRFSFGRYTTDEEVNALADSVISAVERLREMSPLWDMYKDGVDLDSVQWNEH